MSSKPPVQRKGGSTKRPEGPKVTQRTEPKPTFSRGVIGAIIALVALAALSLAIGLGGFSPSAKVQSPKNTSPTATPAKNAAVATGQCAYTATNQAASGQPASGSKFVGLPPLTPVAGMKVATVKTNRGTITFELATKAPCTTNSFAFLASKNFFNQTPCHRLLAAPGFSALQCGDPSGTGTGGPGYKFADENLVGATYPRGTVAMANSGPDTNGSQFFFVIKDSKFAPNYTPFGRVISGLAVLDAIAADGTGNGQSDGVPKKPVTISTVALTH